ncbi:RDD family protein [Streptomyces sp. CoT10]|uniref:RDD family protein n=1 Tax=Streptomyces sp. CoT10 TaxID=2875762 RepID=UPI001CD65700|nr:RDD family protein [Streptomyces sp. CoT10]
MSELVTGEAVALEVRPARLPSRALAVILDLVVTVMVYIAVSLALMASTASLDEAARIAVSIGAFLLVLVGGPIAVETLSHGRSLGKMACGLRVVRDDGGPIRFRHALVRGAIGVVEILLTSGVVACIASLVSSRGRRLGDVFAGTLVVRERVPAGQATAVPPPPPWLAGRFSALDLSAVPDGLWLAVRQYLTRMQTLDPQVGWSMAERLAADLAARTGTPAPREVPPAMYLAAVLQERQAREARRAFGGGSATGASVGEAGVPVAGSGTAPGAPGFPAPQPPAHGVPQPPAHGVGEQPGTRVSAAEASPAVPQDTASRGAPARGAPSTGLPAQHAASEDTSPTERPGTGFVPPA